MMRFIVMLLGVLGHLAAAVPNTTPDGRFGHLAGTEISASAYDPASGTLYVGGLFTGWQQPDGFGGTLSVTRGNLCAFAADGSVRSWAPTTDGQVYGMCLSGTTLYISGYFSQVNGVSRPLVAAISTVDGSLLPFDADITGAFVNDMVVSGGLLYFGGDFTQVHGQPRARLAAVDATSGTLAPWNPGCTGGQGITAMAASGNVIYIGGWFDHVGGQPRSNAAAVDSSGTLLAWDPNATGSENSGHIKDLKVAFGAVFAGGYFENIGGVARSRFAALDPTSGSDLGWDLPCDRAVFSISPTASDLVIGGIFSTVAGQSRGGRAIISSTGILTSWQPTPADGFYTIVAGNGGIYGGAGVLYAHSPIDSTPAETFDVNKPDSLATIGGFAYFGGTTARYGRELWATDGTPSGTSLVKDIVVGNAGSGARHVTAMGGKVYFSANDGAHGRELWVSDGTEGGTHIVKDIAPGGNSSNPNHLFAIGSKLVFTAFQPGIGWGMWATDGTEAGTVLINDVETANTADEYSYNWGATYCVVGSTLYFNATNAAHGSALWKTDGTAAGSRVVKNIAPGGAGGTPIAMTTMGGKLYYTSRDDNSQLWVSDGTDGGTVQYTNAFWYCDFTTAIGGLVYVRATNGSMTNGMWVTDGDPSHLTLLSTTLSAAGFYVERGGFAYMNPDAPSPYSYRPLVGSDGTPGGTGVVADVSCNIPYTVGNTLYFSSPINDASARLWKSEGTAQGTIKVTDRIANAAAVGQVAGKVLVSRLPDWNDYSTMWASDGTDAGTVRLLPRTSIAFTAPTTGPSWSTTLTSLPIAGTSDDPQGIQAVTYQLSGATTGSGTATGTTIWNFTPTLNLGTTTIIVTAESTDGNLETASLAVTVTSPATGSPTIAISLPTTGDSWLSTGGGVTISGTTSDSATVTGVTYALSGATSGSGSATGTASWTFSPTLNPGITIVTMTAVDTNNHTGQDAITITRDLSDPIIAISSPVNSGTYLSGTARVAIGGSATDDGGIASISYELSGATVASGTATGTTSWSLSTPSLNHGVTTITITAHDVANRTSVATLDLLYPTTSEVGTGSASRSCGFGLGAASLLMFAFLGLMRFRRQPPAER
jgi:ELWxxDGT repeat protein